jgi:hypothetical protein
LTPATSLVKERHIEPNRFKHVFLSGQWTMSSSVDAFGISDSTILIYACIIFILCQSLNICGIATNIISIICFVRQGFDETSNISLLGNMTTMCVLLPFYIFFFINFFFFVFFFFFFICTRVISHSIRTSYISRTC